MRTIIVATPYVRHDTLIENLKSRLPDHEICRIWQKSELNVDLLSSKNPDKIFFPHWSWMIPSAIFSRYECIVFHMTDLPFGRGGSPLQNLIVRGHAETKLTALKCTAVLDGGPIYAKLPLSLQGTAEQILLRAAALTEDLIVEICETSPVPTPQKGQIVPFRRRRSEDGDIATLDRPEVVFDYIRMLDADGYPPAYLETDRLRLEFSDAKWRDGELQAIVTFKRREDE